MPRYPSFTKLIKPLDDTQEQELSTPQTPKLGDKIKIHDGVLDGATGVVRNVYQREVISCVLDPGSLTLHQLTSLERNPQTGSYHYIVERKSYTIYGRVGGF